jgi:tRNA/tmRNA/rRNA uracil-C5-methylase (TrmA/RlmC/RlmD family)
VQVDRFVRRPVAHRADLVVLDPPRSGAGRRVVEELVRVRPRAIAYVACDPAALARDLWSFGERGYALSALRAFDLFPMTHHVEAVAILRRAPRQERLRLAQSAE